MKTIKALLLSLMLCFSASLILTQTASAHSGKYVTRTYYSHSFWSGACYRNVVTYKRCYQRYHGYHCVNGCPKHYSYVRCYYVPVKCVRICC